MDNHEAKPEHLLPVNKKVTKNTTNTTRKKRLAASAGASVSTASSRARVEVSELGRQQEANVVEHVEQSNRGEHVQKGHEEMTAPRLLVPLDSRLEALNILACLEDVSWSDARLIEAAAYAASTRRVDALVRAEDPICALEEPAALAWRATIAYCAAVKRAALFYVAFGGALKSESLVATASPQRPGCDDTGSGRSWQHTLGALSEDGAVELAAHFGAWAGWTDFVRKRDAAALHELTREVSLRDPDVSSADAARLQENQQQQPQAPAAAFTSFACQRCGSADVEVQRLQTRSLDEGETTFVHCRACGKTQAVDTS
jgi:DNA-directed RNA polymerase subunit M/transcription elongation factor TFIIS